MKQETIKIRLFGELGESVGKEYNLAVNTFPAAMSAINVLSSGKFFRELHIQKEKNIKYRILLNGRDFFYDKNDPPRPDNIESIKKCELCGKTKNLKTIDIVPVLEGSTFITLIISIIVSVVAAVIINALSKPPELQEYKEKQKSSFLFSGPENTISEGGPVPIGYGRLMVGSAVVSAAYNIGYFNASDNERIVKE